MRILNHRIYPCFLTMMTIFFLIGCAGKELKIDLPANHPANPQSDETAFTPPPNPFQESIPGSAQEAGGSSVMTHGEHESPPPDQMHPKMDKRSHDPRSSQTPEAQKPEHHQKEHPQ